MQIHQAYLYQLSTGNVLFGPKFGSTYDSLLCLPHPEGETYWIYAVHLSVCPSTSGPPVQVSASSPPSIIQENQPEFKMNLSHLHVPLGSV